MIIAHISDTHIALDAPDGDRRMREFADTIADINALDPAPDVIVHSGDIVHNGRKDEYARAVDILSAAHAPTYVMAGNKDDRANLKKAFSKAEYLSNGARFVDYAIEDYPIRLIALDTLGSVSNKGDFCDERLDRLRAFLDADEDKPAVVFTHHPPFEVGEGPVPINFDTIEAMSALSQALQRSNRVAGVFSGHVHRAASGHVGNIPAIVIPCIATSLRWGDYPAPMKTRPVYYIHRFDPAGGFTTEARIVGA